MAATIDLGKVVGADGKDSVQKYNYTLSFPASNWTKQSDGSYTQKVTASGMLASDYAIVDVDMSGATADTFGDLLDAWSAVSRAQTQAGGLLLTCFENAPAVNLPVKAEVIR